MTVEQRTPSQVAASARRRPRQINANARAVLEALRATPRHPTATEIYAVVRLRHPRLGRATVYRALAALETAGLVTPVSRDTRGRHYEARTVPHDHAVCGSCGSIRDVVRPDVDLPAAFLAAAAAGGYALSGFAITYYGRCAACLAADDSAAPARAGAPARKDTRP